MKFYCIFKKHDASSRLLEASCKKKNINFVQINPLELDYTKEIDLKSGDILYKVMIGQRARKAELFLLNGKVTTFYSSFKRAISSYNNTFLQQKMGTAIPKTVNHITKNRKLLKKYVNYLGGFPIIIKAMGGSHGVGVMKIDSFSSLFSVIDYLTAQKGDFIIREFINVTKSARLVVLGDRVVDSIEYTAPEGDFRSNEGRVPNVKIKKFSEEAKKTAVDAVNVLDLEFGGVDMLIDKNGKHYIVEVNFPCFFPRCQSLTGTDISGMIIDYLVDKTKR